MINSTVNIESLSKGKFGRVVMLAIGIMILGVLFRLMHWPYASVLTLAGSIIILVFYPLRYFYKPKKEIVDHLKLLLMIALVGYFVMDLFAPSWKKVCLMAAALCMAGIHFFPKKSNQELLESEEQDSSYLGEDILDMEIKPKKYDSKIPSGVMIGAFAFIIVGGFFKIQHWPGASWMLICGCGLAIISILLSTFRK